MLTIKPPLNLTATISNFIIDTRNPLISAFKELGLDFSQELTRNIIISAYEKYIPIYNRMLNDGEIPGFNLEDKEDAVNYLIEFYKL